MELNPVFSDGMVLQKGKPVRFFGTGEGEGRITFCGRSLSFVSRGPAWTAELPPMEAGGPYTAEIELNGKKTVLSDVFLGDVYLLSGQSNMQFRLSESNYPKDEYRTHPLVRLFSLQRPEEGQPVAGTPSRGPWVGYTEHRPWGQKA